MTAEKHDWHVYRFKVDGEKRMAVVPTTEEPWPYLAVDRVVSMELMATVHGCTETKANAVMDALNLD